MGQRKYFNILQGILGGGGASQPLQYANVLNRFPRATMASTGTQLKWFFRQPITLGSGDLSELRVGLTSWRMNTGDLTANGNAFTVESMALEKVTGGAAFTPVLFSGGRSITINSGDNDINSDAILPSSFSLASFTRGHKYFLRGIISVTTAGHVVGTSAYFGTEVSGSTCVNYDPATCTLSTPIDGTGTISGVGSGFVGAGDMKWIILGKFTTGAPKVFIGIGDSIVDYTGDTVTTTAASPSIAGFFSLSLIDADYVSNPRAGLNMGKGSGVGAAWTTANQAIAAAYLKYANVAVEEYGTNDVTQWANSAAIHTLCKAQLRPLTVIRTKLIPRTNSTLAVSALTSVGTTATATVASTATMTTGNSVTMSGATGGTTAYNGTYNITVINGTQFTYVFAGDGDLPATGTILVNTRWINEADQTYQTATFQPAGAVDTFNANVVAGGNIDFAVDFTGLRGVADHKFAVDGTVDKMTADGTHPAGLGGHRGVMAPQLRTLYTAQGW